MSDQPPPTDDQFHAKRLAEKRLVGDLLMAVGGLIAGLCGLCTLALGGVEIVTAVQYSNPYTVQNLMGSAAVLLVVGGLPTAAGVVVFWTGLEMYREGRKRGGEPWKAFE